MRISGNAVVYVLTHVCHKTCVSTYTTVSTYGRTEEIAIRTEAI